MRDGHSPAIPPSPLLEPDAAAPAPLSSVDSVGPSTPVCGANAQQDQRGRSSTSKEGAPAGGADSSEEGAPAGDADSSEEGAPAGNADGSEVVPLLEKETGGAARGLRWRHGLKGSAASQFI